ncbi:hypothetical protein ATCC90586_006251 [Pythium insidiosum]|nr:hypothetical protein ATCC90586_006251 [Pythium insidiosum]
MAPTGYDRSATSASVGLHVRLSSRAIHRLWVLLIAVQCINTIVLLGRAYIYLAYGLNPASFLRVVVAVFLTKDQQQFVHHNYTVIGGSFGVLAFLFIGSTWKTIRASRRSADRQISPTPPPAVPPFRGKPRPMGSFARVQRTVGGVQARILALWVSLGVRGERFEYGFVAREGLEMALQSMQAYSASQLITNTTIVLVAAVLIAISGLVHPLLTRVHHSNEAMRRFVSIVIEFILDFAWVGEYERSRLEIQQIMLLSWPELGLSMFPFVDASHDMLAHKRHVLNDELHAQMLAKALHYVAADLSQDDWSIELERRGFDQQQPTLWVLEGLLYYMTKDSIVRCEQQDEGDSDALWSAHALKYGEDDPRQGVLTLLHWPLFVNADLGRRGQFFGRDWTPPPLRLQGSRKEMPSPSRSTDEDDSGDDVMRWFLVSATKTTSEPTFGPQS